MLFDSDTFSRSRVEIESLGFSISSSPSPNSRPYAVIGGRSNARWWFIPLANRFVTTSGLAMFQPIIFSAKILKGVAASLSSVGLTRCWANNILHISGAPLFSDIFCCNDLQYAFFTGTDSPHRKIAIQIMNDKGTIKGFAKASCNAAVKPLLLHEAEILNFLNTLDLKTAHIPKVLFSNKIGNADVLLTDTLKSSRTKTATALNSSHLAFLRELAERTAAPATEGSVNCYLVELRNRYEAISAGLTGHWRRRFEELFACMVRHEGGLGAKVLIHGDFTPWNSFFVDGKLYVFDWEYARAAASPGYDLIHFLLSLPGVKHQSARDCIAPVRKALQETKIAKDDPAADAFILMYLCGHSLQYISRELETGEQADTWDGEQETAFLIDAIIGMLGR